MSSHQSIGPFDYGRNKNDQTVFDLLSSGKTVGLFQLESSGMRDALTQMKPNRLEDIIALVALYRPGPMSNIPIYNDCKHGKRSPDYLHPKLEKILKFIKQGIVAFHVMIILRSLLMDFVKSAFSSRQCQVTGS